LKASYVLPNLFVDFVSFGCHQRIGHSCFHHLPPIVDATSVTGHHTSLADPAFFAELTFRVIDLTKKKAMLLA